MPNTLLTVSQITRKAIMILEQKLNFIGNINRQYDSSFANSGAKIGDQLRIRLPNQYAVRSGATLAVQDTVENSIVLPVTTQKGVDTTFSSAELTMSMDDFAERILNPGMSVLSAAMESDAFTMANDVPNMVGTPGTPPTTLAPYLQAGSKMKEYLTPVDGQWSMIIPPTFEAAIVDGLKGLFQDAGQISTQYKEGKMGRTAGFDWYSNTLIAPSSRGNADPTTISGTTLEGASSLVLATVSAGQNITKGTIFSIAGVAAVHPQTKQPMGASQYFVVTGPVEATGTTMTVPVYPPLYAANTGMKTVTALPADGAVITFVNGAVGQTYAQGLGFHKDAFTFATADLIKPDGVDFSAREVWQNLSMRVVRQYDINADKFPTRIDVLYGWKALRPQMACRIIG